MQSSAADILHASAVAWGSKGLLITGKSGSGKSSLALQLMALGAALVADDRVLLAHKDGGLLMSAPPELRGRIEARHLGILKTDSTEAWLTAVVDMDTTETKRLPPVRETVIAGVNLRLFHRVETPAFASILKVMLTGGVE